MKNIRLIFAFVTLYLASSCADKSFLDETQTTDLSRETVFADSTYTAGFLNQIYVDIGFDTDPDRFSEYPFGIKIGHGGLQTACDEAEFKISSSNTTDVMFATGTVNPVTVSKDAWEKCYRNIRRVNVFLKYVDGSPMIERAKTTYKAEARFLRAWYYFILLRHYGGVPLIGDNVYDADDEMKTSRDTFADCVDYIIKECQAAGKDLPSVTTGRSSGRISDAACKALVSRVLLHVASDFYNGTDFAPDGYPKELLGYPEKNDERWKDAADAARAVIAMNSFKLFERHVDQDNNPDRGWGFYAVFKPKDFGKPQYAEYEGETYPGGAYCELILEKKRGDGNDLEQFFYPPSLSGNNYGGYAYHDLAEAFPMADGLPIGESKYAYDPLSPQVNRDPRFNNTIIYDGCLVVNNPNLGGLLYVYTYQGNSATEDAIHKCTSTGYYIRKLTHHQARAAIIAPPQSRPLIRYAEILLNYAEAVNRYYGPQYTEVIGSVEMGPLAALKAIRKRAGIEAGDDGNYGLNPNMTKVEMEDAIRLERRLELAYEGFRFFDVRRWGIAEQTDNKAMHGYEITKQMNGNRVGRVITVRTHVFRPAMYFWPIPYDEVVKSEDLLQNPYYEQ